MHSSEATTPVEAFRDPGFQPKWKSAIFGNLVPWPGKKVQSSLYSLDFKGQMVLEKGAAVHAISSLLSSSTSTNEASDDPLIADIRCFSHLSGDVTNHPENR